MSKLPHKRSLVHLALWCLTLTSFCLSVVVLKGYLRIDFLSPTIASRFYTYLWYIAEVILILVSIASIFLTHKPTFRLVSRQTLLASIPVLLILATASIPRLMQLDHLGIFLDERYWIQEAQGLLSGKIISPFGFIGDQPSNFPALGVALLLLLTDNVYLAARLPGVIYSLVFMCLCIAYVRRQLTTEIAVVLGFLIATSVWDIHMSRWGWSNVTVNPLLIMGIIYFFSRIKEQHTMYVPLIGGILLGTSINLFYVSMLMIIPIALSIPVFILQSKQSFRKGIMQNILLLGIATFITISPSIAKVIKYPQRVFQRHEVFIAENVNRSKNAQNPLAFYSEQILTTLHDFVPSPKKYAQSGLWGISINPLVFITMILGLAYVLLRMREGQYLFLVLSFAVMFIPVVVLNRFTSIWREYGFLPTIFIFSAFGIHFLYSLLCKISVRLKPKIHRSQKMFPLYLLAVVVSQAILFTGEYRIFSENDLAIRPNYVETLCKETAEYVKNTIPFSMSVAFPDHLCSHLTRIALEKERTNVSIYQIVPRLYPNEVVIYFAIAERGVYDIQFEAQLDKLAFGKSYKKTLISTLGSDRAYIYTRDK